MALTAKLANVLVVYGCFGSGHTTKAWKVDESAMLNV